MILVSATARQKKYKAKRLAVSGPKQPLKCGHFPAWIGKRFCQTCYNRTIKESPSSRARRLKKAYGITDAQYAVMLQRQLGLCAICLKAPGKKRLAVDHDHKTGRVRGLACWRCNYNLLSKYSSPDNLRRAAAYLESTFDGRAS